ncbi:Protein CBG23852, partial [Caenorhabditis briggsae]
LAVPDVPLEETPKDNRNTVPSPTPIKLEKRSRKVTFIEIRHLRHNLLYRFK